MRSMLCSKAPWVCGLLVVAGCGGLEPVAVVEDDPITDPSKLYMQLELDYRAVTLSTAASHNTWQLTATPVNGLGEPITGLPAPTFHSADTNAVHVSATGLMTARGATFNTRVVAEVVAPGNVRHADTAFVTVNALDPAPVPARLELDPVSPDSALVPLPSVIRGAASYRFARLVNLGTGDVVKPRVFNSAGDPVSVGQFEYTSLDPTILEKPRRGAFKALRPGRARVVVRTTAYGVTLTDTAVFTITPASGAFVTARTARDGATVFAPSDVTVRAYGIVIWNTAVGGTVDVVFDDPTAAQTPVDLPSGGFFAADVCEVTTGFDAMVFDPGPHCGSGDFSLPPNSTFTVQNQVLPRHTVRIRQFPTPGVYTYRTTTGATGRVIVLDHLAP